MKFADLHAAVGGAIAGVASGLFFGLPLEIILSMALLNARFAMKSLCGAPQWQLK